MNAAVGADERLVVMLEARIADFEKRMRQAEQRGTRTYQGLRRGSRTASQQMQSDMARASASINQTLAGVTGKIGAFGKAFIGGLAAGAVATAFAAVTDGITETVKGIAEIGDEAKRSGLGLQAFQEWKYVADQNRVSIDALTDGFKELNLRADEWIKTGSGSGAESFQRLGFTADDLAKRLKNPSELMLEIVKRLQSFDNAARIRIMDELFGGTGGEQFVQLIDKGESGLRQMIQSAHEVGRVMDAEMIENAQELDRKWNDLTERVSNFGKTLALALADIPFDMIETRLDELFSSEKVGRSVLGNAAYDALKQLGALADDQVSSVENLRNAYSGLIEDADAMSQELASAASMADMLGNDALWQVLSTASKDMRELSGQFSDGSITGKQFAAKLAEIQKNAYDALGELQGIDAQGFSGVISNLGALGKALASLIPVANQLTAALPGADATATFDDRAQAISEARSGSYEQSSPYAPKVSVHPTSAPQNVDFDWTGGGSGGGGGGGSGRNSADAIAQIVEETAALQAKTQALLEVADAGSQYGDAAEYAAVKAKLLTAMQQQGIKVTPELAARIDDVAQAYGKAAQGAADASDRLKDMQAESERGKEAIGGIFSAMLQGADAAKQALAQLLMKIAEAQAMKGFEGLFGSSGGGIFSGIGSALGLYSTGGYTGDGGKYEPAGVVHRGEYVFSKEATARIGSGNLDALHRRAKGYASGGLVGAPVTGSAGQKVQVEVVASFDEEGSAIVKRISHSTSQAAVSQGLQTYDRTLPVRVQQINAKPRMR